MRRRRAYKPRARRCKACGEAFTPQVKQARYCSDGCRKKAWRQTQRAKAKPAPKEERLEVVHCACCGQPFFATEGKGQRYCTSSCRTQAWRRRRDAAVEALAVVMGIPDEKAADVVEVGGLRQVSTYLATRGYTYRESARVWAAAGPAPNPFPSGEGRARKMTP